MRCHPTDLKLSCLALGMLLEENSSWIFLIVKRTGLKPRTLVRFTIQKLAGKASIAKPRALARG